MKKQRDLRSKKFVERVIHINKLLERFPNLSSTMAAAKMPKDKILDLLEASMPHAWQKHMHLQVFETLESTIKEFVNFCKQLESTEDAPDKKGADNSANQKGWDRSKHARTTENKKQGRSNNNDKDKLQCMLHRPNPIQNTKKL